MQVETNYKVGERSFKNKSSAEYYQKILDSQKAYHDAAQLYQDTLNNCTCEDLNFVKEISSKEGESYQNEFDDWIKSSIRVSVHKCNCCGKIYRYGAFDGKESHWQFGGNLLVKKGVF